MIVCFRSSRSLTAQGGFRLAPPETRKTGLQPRLLQHHPTAARYFGRRLVRPTVNAV